MKRLAEMTQEEKQAEYVRNAAEAEARHMATAVKLLKDQGYRVVKLDLIDTGPGYAYLIEEEL